MGMGKEERGEEGMEWEKRGRGDVREEEEGKIGEGEMVVEVRRLGRGKGKRGEEDMAWEGRSCGEREETEEGERGKEKGNRRWIGRGRGREEKRRGKKRWLKKRRGKGQERCGTGKRLESGDGEGEGKEEKIEAREGRRGNRRRLGMREEEGRRGVS